MRVMLSLCIGVVAFLGWMGVAFSADHMRCNSRLISVGDPADKLLATCGAPTSVDESEEERVYYFNTPPPPDQYRSFEHSEKGYRVRKFIKIEVWTYNNGPSRFIEYARIENGKIVKFETGGYGY
jgi:hypothetical protein